MILETSRLILRPFQDEDIGRLAELMASRDFMRFSLGPYTREQTETVLQKFLSRNHAGLPSQFAVVLRENNHLLGYCAFLHHHELPEEIGLPAGSCVLEPWSHHGSRTRCARLCVCRSKITTSDFPDSSGKHSLASCGRENWNDAGKGNYVSRLSDDCVCVVSGEMAGGEWRWMNSRASAR